MLLKCLVIRSYAYVRFIVECNFHVNGKLMAFLCLWSDVWNIILRSVFQRAIRLSLLRNYLLLGICQVEYSQLSHRK